MTADNHAAIRPQQAGTKRCKRGDNGFRIVPGFFDFHFHLLLQMIG